jgi:hypothetical protein
MERVNFEESVGERIKKWEMEQRLFSEADLLIQNA